MKCKKPRRPIADAGGEDRLRQIANELRATRDKFRSLIENIAGYVIFTVDQHGIITSWNRGIEQLLGYSEAEVVGRPFAFIFTADDQQRGEPAKEMAVATEIGEISE